MTGFLTVAQAAERLGVSPRRVLALIKDGRLPSSERFGQRAWLVKETDLEAVSDRKPGRPPSA